MRAILFIFLAVMFPIASFAETGSIKYNRFTTNSDTPTHPIVSGTGVSTNADGTLTISGGGGGSGSALPDGSTIVTNTDNVFSTATNITHLSVSTATLTVSNGVAGTASNSITSSSIAMTNGGTNVFTVSPTLGVVVGSSITFSLFSDQVQLNGFHLASTNSGTETADLEFDNGTLYLAGTETVGASGNLDLTQLPALSVLYNNGSQVVQGTAFTGTNSVALSGANTWVPVGGGGSTPTFTGQFTYNAGNGTNFIGPTTNEQIYSATFLGPTTNSTDYITNTLSGGTNYGTFFTNVWGLTGFTNVVFGRTNIVIANGTIYRSRVQSLYGASFNNEVFGNSGNNTDLGTFSLLVGDSVSIGSGTQNTFIGNGAANSITSGSFNTFLGEGAGRFVTSGSNNVIIGNTAGSSLTGSNNIIVGSFAGNSLANSSSNNIEIGASGTTSDNGYVRIGTSGLQTNLIFPTGMGLNLAGSQGTSGQILGIDSSGHMIFTTASGGSGTVTSAGLTMDGTMFNSSVTGSPITTSGTFLPTLANAAQNSIWAGPPTGGAGAPSYQLVPTFNGTNVQGVVRTNGAQANYEPVYTPGSGVGDISWFPATNVDIVTTATFTNIPPLTYYTNTSGSVQLYSVSISNQVAAVAGNSTYTFSVSNANSGGWSNQVVGLSTLITSIAMNYTNDTMIILNTNAVLAMTNTSTGIGNAAGEVPSSGQIVTIGNATASGVASLGGNNTFTGNNAMNGSLITSIQGSNVVFNTLGSGSGSSPTANMANGAVGTVGTNSQSGNFTFGAPLNVNTTSVGAFSSFMMNVTNTSGSPIVATGLSTWKTNAVPSGGWSITNDATFTFSVFYGLYTNVLYLPIN